MVKHLRRICRDESAATTVEYGLILAMIVLAMLTALGGVANESSAMWGRISQRNQEAVDKAR